ncbi:MAG: hypothetical protein ABII09_12325 [Planctomycetota bacterium]
MEFTLVYRGQLKPDKSAEVKDKWYIRREIHKQLAELWKQEPLYSHMQDSHNLLNNIVVDGNPQTNLTSIIRKVDGFRFIPLVCLKLNLVAELNVIFLRPEPPGLIITKGGDIDNRLKTLFDALRMPQTSDEIKDNAPEEGENPFFCLLEDDNLITKVSVTTDRLLEPLEPGNRYFVNLLMSV